MCVALKVAAGQFALLWFSLCHLDVLLRPLPEKTVTNNVWTGERESKWDDNCNQDAHRV